MKEYAFQTPVGLKDYTYTLMEKKEALTTKMKNLYIENGYHLIETPTFEYLDVFKIGLNDIQAPDSYKIINNSGEILALRSDMTKAIARVVSTETKKFKSPQKLCYAAKTFRYPKQYLGRLHEFTQAGVELIGSSSIYADFEVLSLAIKSLKIALEDYTLHLSSTDFISKYFNELNIDKNVQNLIFKAIEDKNVVEMKKTLKSANLSDYVLDSLSFLINSVGKLDLLTEIKKRIKNEETKQALKRLEELYNLLSMIGLEKNVFFDFSLISYGNYYTGIYFQAYTKGMGNIILEGGRYDNLLSLFKNDKPAVGFGLNINDLLECSIKYENNDLKMIYATKKEEVIKYIENNNGFMSLEDTLEETMNYGKEYQIKEIINLDDMKKYVLEEGEYILWK